MFNKKIRVTMTKDLLIQKEITMLKNFLVSDGNFYITGLTSVVDGGWIIIKI